MKRIAVLVLVFALSLSLFSCGNSAENSGCEAFEFMSDGEYALTLAIGEDGDHGVLIYLSNPSFDDIKNDIIVTI